MSMDREHGWDNYYCYACGKLLGHFYTGFGLRRLYGWLRMKYHTLWKICPECAFKRMIRLRGGQMWVTSTPMIKNSYFQKVWEEAKEVKLTEEERKLIGPIIDETATEDENVR